MSETTPPDEEMFSEPLDTLSIQVAGAMARQYADDARSFLGTLAGFLVSTLGEEAVQIRRAGLFGGDSRPVRRLEVEFPDAGGGKSTRYAMEDTNGRGALTATRTHVVRNIALKTEPVAVEIWIEAVGAAIAAEAERNKSARNALRDIL